MASFIRDPNSLVANLVSSSRANGPLSDKPYKMFVPNLCFLPGTVGRKVVIINSTKDESGKHKRALPFSPA